MEKGTGIDTGGTKILMGIVGADGTTSHERRYASQRGTQMTAIAAVERAAAV